MRRVTFFGLALFLAFSILGLFLNVSHHPALAAASPLPPEGETAVSPNHPSDPVHLLYPPYDPAHRVPEGDLPPEQETAVSGPPLPAVPDAHPEAAQPVDKYGPDWIRARAMAEKEPAVTIPPPPSTESTARPPVDRYYPASVSHTSTDAAPQAPTGLYTITLQSIHRNKSEGGLSSTFTFTNTGASTVDYTIHFHWQNGVYQGSDGPFSLGPGAGMSYNMADAPFGEEVFFGYVFITGDEPLTGQVTTPDYALIQGTVVADDGLTPVEVYDVHANHAPPIWIDFGGAYNFSDGRFYLGGLPADDYALWVYAPYPWASQWYNGHFNWNDADPIPLSSGEQVTLTVTLQPGGRISGAVYAADGVTPLSNVNVDIEQGGVGTCTDGNGRFLIEGLPYGDYRVRAGGDWNWCLDQPSDYAKEYYLETPDPDQASWIPISSGNDTAAGINFTLDLGGKITGAVYADDGVTPLPDIHVDVERGGYGTCTDANGQYVISGLPQNETYYARAGGGWNWCKNQNSLYATEYYAESPDLDGASPLPVDAGNLFYSNVDFTLDVGGMITGLVTAADSGLPLANTRVSAQVYDTGQYGGDALSDATGIYTITGLAAADYRVAVDDANQIPPGYAFEFYPDTRQHDAAARVPVTLGAVTPDIDFALEPGGTITGHVVDQATGLPLPFMKVEVHSQDGPWGWGACTDANGDYEHSALPYGDYKISAGGDWNWCQDEYTKFVQEFYFETPFYNEANTLTLDAAADPIQNINFTLEEGGYLAGTVSDDGGAPVAGLQMEAILPTGDCPWCYQNIANTQTDANGDYVLGPLPGVPLGVYACTDCTGQLLVSEYYDDVYEASSMTLITPSGGVTTTGIDFALDPGVWLMGHVSVPPGYDNEGIPMSAWKTDGIQFHTNRQTGANGDYIIPAPPIYDSHWGLDVQPWGTDLGFQWAHQFDLGQHTQWDFDLDVGGTITGCISDGGVPVSGVWVTADAGVMHQGTESDENGCYAISNLPPTVDGYEIRADDWSSSRMWTSYGGHSWGWFTRIPLETGETVGGIDFEVPLRGQIEGYVYESDGTTPIEGVRVVAMNDDGFWEGYSQPDGYFTIDVPVGPHKLRFEQGFWEVIPVYYPDSSTFTWADATPVTVTALPTTTVVTMNLERPSTVSGQITDNDTGDPLGGVHVVVQNIDPAVGREVSAWSDCTDEFGDYHIHPVWPGDSVVQVVGTCGAWGYGLVTDTLTVAPGGNHVVDLAMTADTMPKRPFTIQTPDSYDYTPLAAGHNSLAAWEADQIVPALFEPLVQLNDQGQWISDLLVDVPTAANGGAAVIDERLVVTYTLKSGLLWSDGQPLTSDDIRFTWEMLSQPNPQVDPYGRLALQIDNVATPDPQTAVLTYQFRAIPPGYLGAITYLLPEHALAGEHPIDVKGNSHFAHFPVGNGPYVVADWVPGSHLDLAANPNYHKRGMGYPLIEEVRFLFTNSPFWSLVNGVADVATEVTHELPPDYQSFNLDFYEENSYVFYYIAPNTERPYFAETAVRQALYHALDRDTFIAEHWPNRSEGHSWLPPEHHFYSNTLTTYDYDLATAAAMLDAAGWVDSNSNGVRDKNGVELAFDLVYPEGDTLRQNLLAAFQADLATIDVDAALIDMPWEELLEQSRRGALDAVTLGWGLDDRYDPAGYTLFHSNNIATAYNSYWPFGTPARWQDGANDTLMEATRTELNDSVLHDLYGQQLARFTQEVPLWVTGHRPLVHAAVPTLLNFRPHPGIPATWNLAAWDMPPNPYDLTVRKTLAANSPAPQPGTTITYAVRLRNAGVFTVSNAVLVDDLPPQVLFDQAVPAPDSVSGQTLIWQMGDAPGASPEQVVYVAVQIPPTVTHGALLQNQVSVHGDQADTFPGNNGFVYEVTVRDDVDLAVDKYGVGQPAIGEVYDYYIDYANWGGAPAAGSVLTDTLPPQANYLSAQPPPDAVNGDVLTWNLATLPGNQWGGQIEINTELVGAGTVTNTADLAFPGIDVDLTNNSDTATEEVDDILPPVILRPTQGTTDGTPTVSGLAPAGATVDLYDIQSGQTFLVSTTATISGAFSVELALAEGTYIFIAQASKSGLTSDFSNTATIIVDHNLPLDSDTIRISANDANISSGSVRAEVRTLPHRTLDVEAILNCGSAPQNIFLEVTENALFTYPIPPVSLADQGGGDWLAEFRVWLAEPHSSYEIWVEWECGGIVQRELLIFILIDPDGYVYDQSLVDAGTPISDALILDAVVTAFVRLNDAWQVWDAALYGQVNPQVTDSSTDDGVMEAGYYSFLTPSGQYRIEARAPGYQPYRSEALTVITTPVHLNVGLQPISGGSGHTQSPANLDSSGKWVDLNQAWVGDTLTYQIWLENSGDEPAGALRLEDTIPAHTTYVTGSLGYSGGTAAFDPTNQTIWWEGALDGHTAFTVSYQVTVIESPGAPFAVNNPSTVTGPAGSLVTLPELTAATQIQNAPGLQLAPDDAQSGDPGATVSYALTLTNTGNATDTISFSATSLNGWVVTAPDPISLSPGAATTAPVEVTIPGVAPAGAADETTVTAVSALAPTIEDAVTLQTTAKQVAALTLSTSPAQAGEVGTPVTYTHTLRNDGNGSDTFLLTAVSDQGWTVTVSDDPILAPGETTPIIVTVHVPQGITPGAVDTTTVTAQSGFDHTVQAMAEDVTTAVRTDYTLYLPAVMQP